MHKKRKVTEATFTLNHQTNKNFKPLTLAFTSFNLIWLQYDSIKN